MVCFANGSLGELTREIHFYTPVVALISLEKDILFLKYKIPLKNNWPFLRKKIWAFSAIKLEILGDFFAFLRRKNIWVVFTNKKMFLPQITN